MKKRIKKCLMGLYVGMCTIAGTTLRVYAADGGVTLDSVLSLITKFVTIGGGLWLAWGAVVLGISLKDHNGPGIQSAIWQIVGGALILAAGALFGSIST